jgi:hypothetical protein
MTSRMIAVMPDWPAKSMSWRDAPSDDTVFCQMLRRDDDGERANGYSYDAVKIFMPLTLATAFYFKAMARGHRGAGRQESA